MEKGIVIKSTGSWFTVLSSEGETIDCRLKGSFRTKNIKSTNPVAVGDNITFSKESDGNGLIQSIEERKNYIIRRSVNLSKREHILAANIDQALLFVTLSQPETYTGFIDRFLVTAEAYHIPSILIFNKMDIYDEKQKAQAKQLMELYRNIGYECFECVAQDPKSVANIEHLINNKISLLSGHSGAGKSTFINSINPDLELKTAEISSYHQSGKHTTTFAEMIELKKNSFIIDTPGIKGLGVIDIPKETLSHYFLEFRELIGSCKFHNCVHINEPGCAVKQAIEENTIAASRYKNYLAIFNDEDESYRTVDY